MSSASSHLSGVSVRLIAPPETDGEYVGLQWGAGTEEIVHLHDYDRIYSTPGLYEHIVQDLLGCTSPRVVAEGLARAVEICGLDPAQITLLDFGAGSGLVAELAARYGITDAIGVDSLESAREACQRDRPGLYREYVVADLTRTNLRLLSDLKRLGASAMTGAGAFGGSHASADALRVALRLLPRGAPAAFTIDERWTSTDGPGAFRTSLAELISSESLILLERSRFEHRVTTAGVPLYYELFVGLVGDAIAAPSHGMSQKPGPT
jgi:hypothetical protein